MLWKLKKLTPLAPQTAVVKADPAAVYDILTDYDNYIEWFPGANHSKLLVKEGDDLAIAEFAFDKPKDAKLTMECIHTRNEMVLLRKISGDMPVVRVQWNLAAAQGGTEVRLRTELDFSNWKLLLPGVSQGVTDSTMMKALTERMNAFSSEMSMVEGGRKFLEIVETNDHLEVWFMGRKYKLMPLDEGAK